jgi:hypothetical protein
VREEPAGVRTSIVDGAEPTIEKNAPTGTALQNASFLLSLDRICPKKLVSAYPEMTSEALLVVPGNLSCSNAAAICACSAVDRFFDRLRNCLKPPFDELVPFQPEAKPLIFLTPFFAAAPDLDKVRNHSLYYLK